MTNDTVRLVPASPHVVVRDPITREPLPAGGDEKPLDTYWSRRLVDGDVTVAPASPTAPAARVARAPAAKTTD